MTKKFFNIVVYTSCGGRFNCENFHKQRPLFIKSGRRWLHEKFVEGKFVEGKFIEGKFVEGNFIEGNFIEGNFMAQRPPHLCALIASGGRRWLCALTYGRIKKYFSQHFLRLNP